MTNSTKALKLRKPDHRAVDYMKPEGCKDWMTLREVAVEVGRDPSWIRALEAGNRIPIAKRVKVGKLSVRLWSPPQVEEIKLVLSRMKRGRPSSG